jgi:hypothetical protein
MADEDAFDAKIEADAKAGKLDKLAGEAVAELWEEAAALSKRVIEYFGDEPISAMLDCDIALRDMARALLAKLEPEQFAVAADAPERVNDPELLKKLEK